MTTHAAPDGALLTGDALGASIEARELAAILPRHGRPTSPGSSYRTECSESAINEGISQSSYGR